LERAVEDQVPEDLGLIDAAAGADAAAGYERRDDGAGDGRHANSGRRRMDFAHIG
jgi:hypothetical protein